MVNKTIINIAIVDDHQMFRKGTQLLLVSQPNFSVCIEAENGKDLIEKLTKSKTAPDICILDISMPVMNGYDTLLELKKRWPDIKVLVVSTHNHEHLIISMLRKGARGYLLKDSNPSELYKAIKSIHEKGYYHTDLVPGYYSKATEMPELNNREREFLMLCCDELTYKEIGIKMNLSSRTIESYRNALFTKLNVLSRTGLVMFAVRNGIVS